MAEDPRKVFVANLPIDIADDEMRQIFGTYGRVTDVKIIDAKPPGSKKLAFVTYETEDAAKDAIQVLNEVYKFRVDSEEPIQVRIARPRAPKGDSKGDDSRGHGDDWKSYSKTGDDWRASRDSNGDDWKGGRGGDWNGDRAKDWSGASRGWDSGGFRGKGSAGTQALGWDGGSKGDEDPMKLFVAQLPVDIQETEIRQVFGNYGNVIEVKIIDGRPPGTQKCSFVGYDNAADAQTAMQVLHDVYKFEANAEKPIRIAFARKQSGGKGDDRKGQTDSKADDWKGGGWRDTNNDAGWKSSSWGGGDGGNKNWSGGWEGGSKPSGDKKQASTWDGSSKGEEDPKKLFVALLPRDVTEDEVRTIFSTYGPLADIKLIPDKSNDAQQIGFVGYETAAGAKAAQEVLHDVYKFRTDSDRPIKVQFARSKPKEDDWKGSRDSKGDDWKGGRDSKNDDWKGGRGDDWKSGGWGNDKAQSNKWDGGLKADDDPFKVFVAQLPIDITEEEIDLVFSTYGKVNDVNIIDGKPPGSSKVAFIGYETEEGAKAAMQVLHETYKFRSDAEKPIRVTYARRKSSSKDDALRKDDRGGGNWSAGNWSSWSGGGSSGGDSGGSGYKRERGPNAEDDMRKVFVGQLPMDIQEEEVRTIFRTYGETTSIHIIDGKPPGTQKVAFVEYETREGANTAVQALNDVYKFRLDSEQPIRVSIARPKKERNDKGGKGGDWNSHSGYSDYGGKQNRDNHWGSSHGGWDSNRTQNDDRGYGKYDRHSGSNRDRDGPYSKGGHYEKQETSDRRHGSGGKGASASKLHVANLPSDIRKEDLESVFGTYGPLTDVFIMTKSPNGLTAAFVTYRKPEDATSCISAMEQGYEIRPGQGHIRVTVAKEKRDDRYQSY